MRINDAAYHCYDYARCKGYQTCFVMCKRNKSAHQVVLVGQRRCRNYSHHKYCDKEKSRKQGSRFGRRIRHRKCLYCGINFFIIIVLINSGIIAVNALDREAENKEESYYHEHYAVYGAH